MLYQNEIRLNFKRQGESGGLSIQAQIRTDGQGRPKTFFQHMDYEGQIQECSGRLGPKGLEITRKAGTSTQRSVVPAGPDLYSSSLAALLFLEGELKEGRTAAYKVLIEEMGTVTEMTLRVKGKQARGYDIEVEMMGFKGLETVDPKGNLLRSELPGAGFVMEACGEAEAKVPVAGMDLLQSSLIRVEGKMPEPRSLLRALYRLSLDKDSSAPDLPSTGCQKGILRGRNLDLEIISPEPGRGCGDVEEPPESCLIPNLYEGGGDRSVRKAAIRACRGAKTPGEKAELLRQYVHRYITDKNYRSLYATAPEILKSASGDCTEHSVLLSALLKSQKIPARWVLGLVHTGDSFWFHEWVEAFLPVETGRKPAGADAGSPLEKGSAKEGYRGGGEWVPLDAVFAQSRVDASHIVLARVSQLDDLVQASGAVTGLLGRLKIKVLDTGTPQPLGVPGKPPQGKGQG